jgi:hypothetical protein
MKIISILNPNKYFIYSWCNLDNTGKPFLFVIKIDKGILIDLKLCEANSQRVF